MKFDKDDVNIQLIIVFTVSILICIFTYVTSSNKINDIHNNSSIFPNIALAQTINNSSKTQLWVDKEDNAKIIFDYDPESPVIGSPTDLLFSIEDLHTGHEIKERLHVQVVIANEREIFKIINSIFTEGNFSVSYAFPDSGSYKVILKIESKNIEEAPSFNVFVPTQALSSTTKLFNILLLSYVIPIMSATAGIAIYIAYKKKIWRLYH
jgi:hypothetical protein